MKYFFLEFLFCFYPIVLVYGRTLKSVTCKTTEHREEYINGMKSNLGYLISSELKVLIPCKSQSNAEKTDDNDCFEGSIFGGILGTVIALYSSIGKERFWAVPAGWNSITLFVF